MPVPSRGQVSGTPDGTRTHTQTDFKSVASANWATGAYFGWGGRNRTCIVSLPKSDAIPLGDSPSALQIGIEPMTFCSSDRRSTDWATRGKYILFLVGWEGLEPPRSAHWHLIYSQAPSPIWIPTQNYESHSNNATHICGESGSRTHSRMISPTAV